MHFKYQCDNIIICMQKETLYNLIQKKRGILPTFQSLAGVNVICNNCRQSADQEEENHPKPWEVCLFHFLKQFLDKMIHISKSFTLIVPFETFYLRKKKEKEEKMQNQEFNKDNIANPLI